MTKILGFGDSLTAGTPGYEPGYGGDVHSQYGFWILESARKEGVTTLQFHNQGRPGELAIQMRPRLRRLIEREKYDFAIILGGTNDLGWGYEPTKVFEALQNLYLDCLQVDIRIVPCTIPPIGFLDMEHQRKQRELNTLIMGNKTAMNDCYPCDIFSELVDPEGILLPEYDSGDGLHLSIEGYRKIGELIWFDILRHFF
ncbi:MAG: SGNH/GDSL hydrolase family protein [Candidatus Thorarchaeota archaeon]